ncbi:unnamed protein product [Moneuplotes crassus]|uniref:Rab-GAP TBC domain-containing protein n=2 Tax=Euplotes crassus TaxID=5936 RepID=A0AAD2D4H2_EUPCR|nr:unnamed protein product [Moneuplotes crassus]
MEMMLRRNYYQVEKRDRKQPEMSFQEKKEETKKTKKRYRKATLSYCSNGEEDFDEHSDNKLSAISNVSKSFVQERNLEIIENVYTSKKKAKASFISNGGKRQGLLGMIKNKFFRGNKVKRPVSEYSNKSESNYVQKMLVILRKAQKHGIMTEKEKDQMAKLIFKNGGFPKAYRPQLWTLASGSERLKRNNFGYYSIQPHDEDERKSNDDNPELTEKQDNTSDDDICRPLLDSYPEMPSPYKDQIMVDLNRTFIENNGSIDSKDFNKKLFRILLSYSKRNSNVGYCQGMNYLAGMVVRVIHNEETAFWTLCSLFENILPLDYFCLMTEILVDQKVLMMLIQKKQKKLFKHLKSHGVDFPIITFQWFVCCLSCTLDQEVAETVWDLLFLQGTSAIFWASLAILDIMSPDLLKQTEFNDMYTTMDTKPKEMINEPEIMLKHYQKFMRVKPCMISKLRKKFREGIINDQRQVWMNNSRAVCPSSTDSSVLKRVKILNKFFFLNKAIRANKKQELHFELDNVDDRLSCSGMKCNFNWPLCLYDFTIRTRICNFFIFRVSKPVRIIPEYFSDDLNLRREEKFEKLFFFIPFENKDVTIYDNKSERRVKRIESAQIYEKNETEDNEKYIHITEDEQLLMTREVHPCVYNGFEDHFHKMFDTEDNILYMNWTVHTCYGFELQNIQSIEAFVNEILSLKEIEALKSKDYQEESKNMMNREYRNFSHYRLNTLLRERPLKEEKLKRFGSFNFPRHGLDQQIWQSALEVASQSIIISGSSDISSDSDDE